MSTTHSTPQIAARTDRGVLRKDNQDVALAREVRPGVWLLAVADGVGGRRAGDVAAAAAVEEVAATLERSADPRRDLPAALEAANARVYRESQRRPEWAGMASTLVAAVICDGRAWIAHVGDSRAYRVVGGVAERLTRDHTLVEESGLELTQTGAPLARMAHVITRSIGGEAAVEVEAREPVALPPGGTLVLCSDGLHGQIDDAGIGRIVQRDTADPVSALIAAANAAGGRDNVAVALLRF